MEKRRQWIQAAILAAVLLAGAAAIGQALFGQHSRAPRTGDPAPGFTVEGIDGKTYKLGQLAGKPVVLNFWGTFCTPCIEEMPLLQSQADKWSQNGVSVVGINLAEDDATVQAFLDRHQIRFPVYMDRNERIRKAYGVHQYPTTFFIRPDGAIYEIKIGKMDESYMENTISALLAHLN
ncbi:MAG: thiol-disulfide oxidoreductase [Paenibacillaceae bacterium]|nr:thiol-disulfide oxidoreductase [Paenibacillaceae bacterium]